MLVYFLRIQYLPAVDLESVTGVLLSVALLGALLFFSLAVLLVLPGTVMQFFVRYKIINPGAEKFDEKENSPARKILKEKLRINFLLLIGIAEFFALAVTFGPFYFGLTHTIFGWSLLMTTWVISCVFLLLVFIAAMLHEAGWLADSRASACTFPKNQGASSWAMDSWFSHSITDCYQPFSIPSHYPL